MSWDAPDVYYQPEKFGLKPVAEIDYSSESYEFDLRVVWLHNPTRKLYTARDSGCSCPSPFEEYTSLERLEGVSVTSLEAEARKELRSKKSWEGKSQSEVNDFLDKVRHAVETLR